jgi:exodeoxyribonuclease-3
MTLIASWNVNSIKARLPNVLDWVKRAKPDILLLQELKCLEEAFPALEFTELGYNAAIAGQKTYNGVAILSKTPLEVEMRALPGGADDPQARYVEAVTKTPAGVLRVASIYLPNGNPLGPDKSISEKFSYKLAWMKRLHAHAKALLKLEEITVLGGDYNVIPEPIDAKNPAEWTKDALFQPESRQALRRLLNLGYTDAFRALHAEPGQYTFWDYQAGAWPRDDGIRIDHLLLSPQAADRLAEAGIDREPRSREKASDHTPIWCRLEKAR